MSRQALVIFACVVAAALATTENVSCDTAACTSYTTTRTSWPALYPTKRSSHSSASHTSASSQVHSAPTNRLPHTIELDLKQAQDVEEVIVMSDWWQKRPTFIRVCDYDLQRGTLTSAHCTTRKFPTYTKNACGPHGDAKCAYHGSETEPSAISQLRVPLRTHKGHEQRVSDGNRKIIGKDSSFTVNGRKLGRGFWVTDSRFVVRVASWGNLYWVGQVVPGGMRTTTVRHISQIKTVNPTHLERGTLKTGARHARKLKVTVDGLLSAPNKYVVMKGIRVITSGGKKPLTSGWECDKSKNFILGVKYNQIDLTSACPHCNAKPVYNKALSTAPASVAPAVAYCKAQCIQRSGCVGVFYQRHTNGHEICGFYTKTALSVGGTRVWHGHQAGSQICMRQTAPVVVKPHMKEQVFTVSAGKDYWAPVEVTLDSAPTTIIRYEVKNAPGQKSEMIGAFSHNKKRWAGGKKGEDALTWYAAPHRSDFTFRTKVFGGFPHVTSTHQRKVAPDKWHKIEVRLGTSRASYTVDGKHFATTALKAGEVARKGFVGMIRYASDYQFKNLEIITRNQRVWPRHHGKTHASALRATPMKYAAAEATDATCKRTFGSTSRVADFSELTSMLLKDLKVPKAERYPGAWVTRNRKGYWAGRKRHYFIEKHHGAAPRGWLVHDRVKVDKTTTYHLGSWFGFKAAVLCTTPVHHLDSYGSSSTLIIEPEPYFNHKHHHGGINGVQFWQVLLMFIICLLGLLWGYFERERRRRLAAEAGGFPVRQGDYLSGLFECFVFPRVCLPACFFSPVAAAFNRAEVDGRECTLCDACFSLRPQLTQYHTRQSIRAKHNLEERQCTDCFAALCCTPCAVAQDTLELERRANTVAAQQQLVQVAAAVPPGMAPELRLQIPEIHVAAPAPPKYEVVESAAPVVQKGDDDTTPVHCQQV